MFASSGVVSGGTLTGAQMDALSDDELGRRGREASIFARVSPEQKARLITLLRTSGRAVGFLGDGVNDALALHHADIGISVDSATDVAKDAADIVLLDKDLGVLAEGVHGGPADLRQHHQVRADGNVEQLRQHVQRRHGLRGAELPARCCPARSCSTTCSTTPASWRSPATGWTKNSCVAPSHWDIGFIRRFMLLFGPISSLFDFATFALMIFVFHAVPGEFRAGWFIESIATQTLIIFAIRTRRDSVSPQPSVGGTALGVPGRGGARRLPADVAAGRGAGIRSAAVAVLPGVAGLTVMYLVLVESAKGWFFSRLAQQPDHARRRGAAHRVDRRSARFSGAQPVHRRRARQLDDAVGTFGT